MKDKRSNEYDNQTMQNEKHIICINDEIEVGQVMQERENPTLQIKISRIGKECDKIDEKKTKHILQHLHIQKKNGILIIEMLFIGPFIVLMTSQK